MVLAQDVSNSRGQLLVPAGTVLTEKHIGALQMWGISFLHVECPDEASDEDTAALVPPEALERAKKAAAAAFRLNKDNLSHPFFRCLLGECIFRYARRNGELFAEQEHAAAEDGHGANGETLERDPEIMVKKVGTLGSLPGIYQEIVQVVNHPLSSATDVGNVISEDVGLTARLLRIVNSAFYGFPGRIETVSRATAIVGTNELCELALATSVMSIFDRALRGVVNMPQFWLHSLFCGSVARTLGKIRGEPNTERYFVMGLLHDVGRLVMFSEAPRRSSLVLEEASSSGRAVYDVEREVFGFTHAAVGEALLGLWNLPATHREAVRGHHAPLTKRDRAADAVVAHVAEIIANAVRIGRSGDTAVPPMRMETWDQLGLSTDVLRSVIEDAETHVHDLATIFGVEES